MVAAGVAAGAVAFLATVLAFEVPAKYSAAGFAAVVSLVLLSLARNPRQVCLMLVFACAPLGMRITFHRFPHMGGAGAIFIDLVDPFLLLLLYWQWRDARAKVGAKTGSQWHVPPAMWFWAGMTLLGVLSVLIGPLRSVSLNEVVRMAKLLLLAVVVFNEVVERRQFQQVIVAISLMVILQSAVALAQYTMGQQLGLQFLGEATDEDIEALSAATLLTGAFVYRPDGLLGHSNLLAGYLAMNLPVMVALLLAPVARRLKVLLTVALLLGQLALVLTLSRTGWIEYAVAFVLVLALGAVHPVSRRRYTHVRVVVAGITALLALAMSPVIVQRITDTDPTAVEYRLEWLQVAARMIQDNPVLGIGLNSYTYRQLPYGKDRTPEEMTERYGQLWPAVHNSWVLTWAEQGTLGFLLWVAVHVAVLREGAKNLRIRDPMMHALAVGLMTGFIAIMIDGLASFFIRTEAPGRLFWIGAALILACGRWRRLNEPAAAVVPVTAGSGQWLPARKSPLQ
jgi:putative inorganic carbon (hco3(-)) transporter